MEKLPMCRICLVENVRMYVVVNKNLHALYEKLTDIPFVTEDSRPMLACYFCYAKLKQCCQLLSKCLQAEELFAQMMNEDYEPNPLINQVQLEFFYGFIKTPIENISILDVGTIEGIAIKEESPAGERLDDVTEPKEEHLNDEIELENLEYNYTCVEDITPHHSESFNLENDITIMDFKTEVEEVSKKKRRARKTARATVAKKSKLEGTITAKHKETEQAHSTIIPNSQNHTSKPDTKINEPFANTKRGVNNGINNTGIDTNDINSDRRLCIKEKPYKCDICQRCFSDTDNLKLHLQIHTDEKPYNCDICQRSFRVKSVLTRHARTHTGEKPYKFGICQRSFSDKGTLTDPIRKKTGEKPYKCGLCECYFSHKGHLTRHARIHTGEKPHKCDICQRSFSQISNLNRHSLLHNGDKPYKCELCQRCYIDKRDLIKHIREHIGEKPLKCDICQDSFNDKRELTKHIRKHTGSKLFKCEVCQRSFCYSSDLIKHMRIHTGEKPYKCDICQRSFNIKSNLKKHLCVHTGEKPFKCDIVSE